MSAASHKRPRAGTFASGGGGGKGEGGSGLRARAAGVAAPWPQQKRQRKHALAHAQDAVYCLVSIPYIVVCRCSRGMLARGFVGTVKRV